MQEQEMKRLAEDRRREKLEDKLARQRVKEQIERDRQARKEKDRGSQGTAAPEPKPQAATAAPSAPKKDYTEARLQVLWLRNIYFFKLNRWSRFAQRLLL